MPLTEALYGKKAAALFQQAGAFQAEARTFQLKAKDAYFQANNWAGYDDMRRARQYAPSSVTTSVFNCVLCNLAMQPIQPSSPCTRFPSCYHHCFPHRTHASFPPLITGHGSTFMIATCNHLLCCRRRKHQPMNIGRSVSRCSTRTQPFPTLHTHTHAAAHTRSRFQPSTPRQRTSS